MNGVAALYLFIYYKIVLKVQKRIKIEHRKSIKTQVASHNYIVRRQIQDTITC